MKVVKVINKRRKRNKRNNKSETTEGNFKMVLNEEQMKDTSLRKLLFR